MEPEIGSSHICGTRFREPQDLESDMEDYTRQKNVEGGEGRETPPQPGYRPVGAGPERLWAPWRIAYFTEPQPDECVFCTIPADDDIPESQALILARFDHTYVIMNCYPYNTGHLMVVPYSHKARFQDLTEEILTEMMNVSGLCVEVLEETINAQGFNIGFNLGRAAGAGIIDHIHLHVVPRWGGDTNFMPVLGDTRVLPELLEDTYERLRPVFDRKTNKR